MFLRNNKSIFIYRKERERYMKTGKEIVDDLFIKHNAFLLNIIRSKGFNADDAKDILSETFLRFLENLDDLKDLNSLQHKKWLYNTAVNITHERKRCKIKIAENDISEFEEVIADNKNGVDGVIEDQAFDHLVRQMQSELTDSENKALEFILELDQGSTYEELSSKYDIAPVTLRSMIHRLRKRSKVILDRILT